MRVHGCNEMKLLQAGGPEQCIFVLCELPRSLIHEEKERRGGEAIVLPLAFSPCGCLAADSSQKTTMQLQITLPPACICLWKAGRLTGNSL